jgi:transposase
MIVIGADTHKSTHALAAVDAATGQLLSEREIPAAEKGHLDALRWAHELDEGIVWAIEDCRHVSQHLEH